MNTHLNIALAPFDRDPTKEQLDHLIYVDMIEPRRLMSSELRGATIYCACMSEKYGFPAASILQQERDDDGSWAITLVVLAMAEDGRLFSASYDQMLDDEKSRNAFIDSMLNDAKAVYDFAVRAWPKETHFATYPAAAEGTA